MFPILFISSVTFFFSYNPDSAYAKDKIYVTKDADGVVTFSTKPPKTGNAKVFESRKSGFSWYKVIGKKTGGKLFPEKYRSLISSTSERFGVDQDLIRAVIHTESAFDPKAVSPKGAVGLMQIMPFNFKRLEIKDGFEPTQNVRGGTKLLAELHRRYRGDVRLMLAAYNAGEAAVAQYKGIPPFAETQHYVKRVMDLWKRYARKRR